MAQVKKEAVRLAILRAAQTLFADRGYYESTLPEIARRAGVSSSTVYVYFSSKLEIVYTIYGPWLRNRLEQLQTAVAATTGRRERLRLIISTVWQELPQANKCFANVLMQAVSSATLNSGYDPTLLQWAESIIADMLTEACKSLGRPRAIMIAHMLLMSFDGFALGARINPASGCSDAMVDLFVDMLVGGASNLKPRDVR